MPAGAIVVRHHRGQFEPAKRAPHDHRRRRRRRLHAHGHAARLDQPGQSDPRRPRSQPPAKPCGVSVDLARAFAQRLGVGIELVRVRHRRQVGGGGHATSRPTSASSPSTRCAEQGIAFTAPYVLIEGCYLVRDASPIRSNDEVDRPGHRVVVGQGSAYDLFLTRELKQRIDRARADVAGRGRRVHRTECRGGGRRQAAARGRRAPARRAAPARRPLHGDPAGDGHAQRARRGGGSLPGGFRRGDEGVSGFVAAALQRHRIEGASIAPLRNAES